MKIPQKNDLEYQQIGDACRERSLCWLDFPALGVNGIWQMGRSYIPEGCEFAFSRPNWDAHQVLIVIRGEGRGLVDNAWQPLRKGDAYLTPAGVAHAYYACGEWEVCWCHLDRNTFRGFDGSPTIRQANPIYWYHLISGALEESIGNVGQLQMERWFELIHYKCVQIIEETTGHHLWRLWDHVLDHLNVPWSLPRLAREAGVNRETLRQRCLAEQGVSPMAYVTRLRVRRAISLLESGMKVETAARLVGYRNAFAFSAAFQRLMGMPPSRYRSRK